MATTQAVLDQHYLYPFASKLDQANGSSRLALAASSQPIAERSFFRGQLRNPELSASLLLATSEVAMRRFYVPPNMLARILRAADPVVTAIDGRLRFESFSQCCGVYARTDFLNDALLSEEFGKGTTNVDFNPPMRAELSKVRANHDFALHVTPDKVAIATTSGEAIEHKVKLPLRWLRSFAEVQAHAARMTRVHTVAGPEARRFLGSLSKQVATRDRVYIVASGTQLRVSQQASDGSVAASGLGRLQTLLPIARFAEALHVYAGPGGTSGWELDFGVARYLLLLSAEAARGFSGEGQLLLSLTDLNAANAVARVRSTLAWQSDIQIATLATSLRLPNTTVEAALAILASQGLVGVDVRDQTYFHRELPFDRTALDELHPRLNDARELAAQGAVRIDGDTDKRLSATVSSANSEYRVRVNAEEFHCTCTWHSRTQGEMGPCKHVLAVQLAKGKA